MVFLRADGMLFPIAFPFVPPAAHFSGIFLKGVGCAFLFASGGGFLFASGGGFLSTAAKSMQKRRLKPMVSKPPLLSRALLVMGRKGNRLSNRPAAAPTQLKG